IAQEARAEWAEVLGGYLRQRTSLAAVVLLIDIRRGVGAQDRNLAAWVAPTGRPVLALLTKADKLPYGQRLKAVAAARKDLDELGALHVVAFSATDRIGLDEATTHIEQWISPQVAP